MTRFKQGGPCRLKREDFEINDMALKPYYEENGITIYHGDCREVLATPEFHLFFDSVITDPPYGLKFMGKDWDHSVPGFQFWEEIKQSCKPGAMLMAFGGTRTWHRLTS